MSSKVRSRQVNSIYYCNGWNFLIHWPLLNKQPLECLTKHKSDSQDLQAAVTEFIAYLLPILNILPDHFLCLLIKNSINSTLLYNNML